MNTLRVMLVLLLLAGCSEQVPPAVPSEPVPQTLCPVPTFVLTPAPEFETPLQRWRRTKADWDTARKRADALEDEIRTLTWPALEAYQKAEDQLKSIQCGKLCVPEKQQ